VNGFIVEKCKVMDSKKLPLRLFCTNTDPSAPPVEIIFKTGDDLRFAYFLQLKSCLPNPILTQETDSFYFRQDMLTLQMIGLMDRAWQTVGMDLALSVYGCVATGVSSGFIEVVLNAETTANIQKSAGMWLISLQMMEDAR
jgi:phosphatidylinositol kinase/protein kinase (PI-3  family)